MQVLNNIDMNSAAAKTNTNGILKPSLKGKSSPPCDQQENKPANKVAFAADVKAADEGTAEFTQALFDREKS
jgi:hypothetical protein